MYAQKLRDGKITWEKLTPIEVSTDGTNMVVFDGTHRTLAAAVLGEKVPAVVVVASGTLEFNGEWSFATVAQRMRQYFGSRK